MVARRQFQLQGTASGAQKPDYRLQLDPLKRQLLRELYLESAAFSISKRQDAPSLPLAYVTVNSRPVLKLAAKRSHDGLPSTRQPISTLAC